MIKNYIIFSFCVLVQSLPVKKMCQPIPSPQSLPRDDVLGMSQLLIKRVLDTHNTERTRSYIWDNNLQASAEQWSLVLAKQGCKMEHKLSSSAQNLYAVYGSINVNVSDAIKAWIDEKELVDKPGYTFEDFGHYLIVTNESYTNVGCGYVINQDANCYVVTCNYL
jgi:hypothetical protein